MRHDAWAGMLSWWSSQSPVSHSCSFLNHQNNFHIRMFKLNAKFDADSWFYLLSHFECDGHVVHKLTQQSLPPPLTSSVKSSLLTHVHSSPPSLAARLHWCCANHSHYINSGWTFSDQASNIHIHEHIHIHEILYKRKYNLMCILTHFEKYISTFKYLLN